MVPSERAVKILWLAVALLLLAGPAFALMDSSRQKSAHFSLRTRILAEHGIRDVPLGDVTSKREKREWLPDAEIEALLIEFWNVTGGPYWTPEQWPFEGPWYTWPGINGASGGPLDIELDANNITGTIPDSFFDLPLEYLALRGNRLSGTIPESVCDSILLDSLILASNELSGTIPECLVYLESLTALSLSSNHLTGTLPENIGNLTNLLLFIISHNNFFGTIPDSIRHLGMVHSLDFSDNNFSGTLPDGMAYMKSLSQLMLSNNNLTGTITEAWTSNLGKLLSKFVISNNNFHGSLKPITKLKMATVVNVAYNRFTAPLPDFQRMPKIVYLDISFNQIEAQLDPRVLTNTFAISDLAYFNSMGNLITPGTKHALLANPFSFSGNTQLKSGPANWTCMTASTRSQSLIVNLDPSYFNYTHCSCIRGYFGRPPNSCYACPANATFCRDGINLEIPPNHYPIFVDPPTDILTRYNFNIPGGTLGSWNTGEDDADLNGQSTVPSRLFSRNVQHFNHLAPSFVYNPQQHFQPVYFEECPGRDACNSACPIRIIHDSKNQLPDLILPDPDFPCPCSEGHTGRQCSQCVCDPDPQRNFCFYPRANVCVRCSHIWPWERGVMLLLGIGLFIFVVSTVLHVLVLKSKRQFRTPNIDGSNIFKRAFYRIVHVRTIGYFKLGLIWIQTLSALVSWPSDLLQRLTAFLIVTTGNPTGMGLTCILTPLRDPQIYYLAYAMFPLALLVILGLSVFIAHLIWSVFLRPKSITYRLLPTSDTIDPQYTDPSHTLAGRHFMRNDIRIDPSINESLAGDGSLAERSEDEDEDSVVSSDIDTTVTPIVSEDEADYHHMELQATLKLSDGITPLDEANVAFRYFSARSLFISEILAIGYFFYFGISLANVSFTTCEAQPGTGERYLQSYPWIKCSAARSLRLSTIPFFLIYTFNVPILFAALLIYYRKKIHLRVVNDLIGGLYKCYRQPLFWWELVVLARRLALAYALRNIPRTSAFHPWSVFLILAVSVGAQFLFQPFNSTGENRMEEASLLLLIVTYAAQEGSRQGFTDQRPLFFVSLALSMAYLAAVLGLLVRAWWTLPIKFED